MSDGDDPVSVIARIATALQSAQLRDGAPAGVAGRESLTGALRAAMKGGAKTAASLSAHTGVPTRLVSALLKHDIAIGRVRFVRPTGNLAGTYELVENTQCSARLAEAEKLLRSAGYEVTKKGPRT
jgi:hypothetical protein